MNLTAKQKDAIKALARSPFTPFHKSRLNASTLNSLTKRGLVGIDSKGCLVLIYEGQAAYHAMIARERTTMVLDHVGNAIKWQRKEAKRLANQEAQAKFAAKSATERFNIMSRAMRAAEVA